MAETIICCPPSKVTNLQDSPSVVKGFGIMTQHFLPFVPMRQKSHFCLRSGKKAALAEEAGKPTEGFDKIPLASGSFSG